MQEMEFAEIVAAHCERPAMYTMHGTFAEIIAFLDGYAKGAEVVYGYHYSWTPFCQWLAVKYDSPEKSSSLSWQFFLKQYPDEEAALEGLSQLYREYAESK